MGTRKSPFTPNTGKRQYISIEQEKKEWDKERIKLKTIIRKQSIKNQNNNQTKLQKQINF